MRWHAGKARESYLCDGQDNVGGRGKGAQSSCDLVADDFGENHADRLAEHDGLGFDAAHT